MGVSTTDILTKYRDIQNEIKQIEGKIDKLEALARSPRISALTGLPRGSKKRDLSDIVAKIDELLDLYYLKLGQLLDMQAAAEKALEEMGIEERVVIRYKYIDGLSNVAITDRVHYSTSTIRRRIMDAMERLQERETNA